MPAARDLSDDEERAAPTDVIDDGTSSVGFLDLPDLDPDAVLDAVVDGFSRLDDDAVLTAYCTTLDAASMTNRCQRDGLDLVHTASHGASTTFVVRRSSR